MTNKQAKYTLFAIVVALLAIVATLINHSLYLEDKIAVLQTVATTESASKDAPITDILYEVMGDSLTSQYQDLMKNSEITQFQKKRLKKHYLPALKMLIKTQNHTLIRNTLNIRNAILAS